MGEQEANLKLGEAIAKIQDMAKGQIAMMHTFEEGELGRVRPMATAGIDEDGTLWFLSKAGSTKNHELWGTGRMQLTYSVPSRSEFLVLNGQAEVLRDQAKIDQLWSSLDKAWFPDGKDDAAITLIRFRPHVGHYWDTKHGKAAALAGMVVGALTGKPSDDGIEGNLHP